MGLETRDTGRARAVWEGVVSLSSPGGESGSGSPRAVGAGSDGVLALSRHGPGNTSAPSHHRLPSQLQGWMAPSCIAPHPQIPFLL